MKFFLKTISLGLVFSIVCAPLVCAQDPRGTTSPYGVLSFLNWDDDWNDYQYHTDKSIDDSIELMKIAGVGIVRLDITWTKVEPRQGHFDFDRLDRIVNKLKQNNISVLAILHYNATWTGKQWNEAPDPDLFINYVENVVKHFKDRVMYWEIWNEPDAPEYWLPQDNLIAYSALLKRVTPAIKKIDPSAKVLVGGVAKTPVFSIKKIYRLAGKESFDIVNIHPFVNPDSDDPIKKLKNIHQRLRKTMEFYEDTDKPIWFTEIGSPGIPSGNPEITWWYGTSPTEADQAEWVTKLYNHALDLEGVEKVFWAFWRDTSHFNDGIDYLGLLRRDFSIKPAFNAFKEVAIAQ